MDATILLILILLIMWGCGFTLGTGGSLIHLLLVIVVIVALLRLFGVAI